jgi:HAD superfamily hydrolase (TIGR01459 family)
VGASPETQRAAVSSGIPAFDRVSQLAERYTGFILDQWGVLHDGTTPYAGATGCLAQLRAAGKRIVVLSNSGKREADNLALMARMGFDVSLIDRFISAGEEARRAIAARTDAFHRRLGRRCYAFTRGGDRALLEGIGLQFVERIDEAEFIAVLGNDSPQRSLAGYETELRAALERGLPMVCANPDTSRLTPTGIIEGQGLLALRYEALGGEVFWHGKPHPPIYCACLEALGCPREEVIAVGDSIEHDVLGAERVGIASALIPGGVHAAALGIAWGALPQPEAWRRFEHTACARPTCLLAAFNW